MRSTVGLLIVAFLVAAAPSSPVLPQGLGPGRKYTSVERMHPERLSAVRRDRLRISAARRDVGLKTGYNDYRAILHAHAEDAPHTGGTREEMLEAAIAAGVTVVMLSDHDRPERDYMKDSWRGIRRGVLFIPGAESGGFLVHPVSSVRDKPGSTREDFIRVITLGGGLIFLSHVEEKLDWPMEGLNGLEIYNHHTDVKDEAAFNLWLRSAFTDKDKLRDLEELLNRYPEEVFAAQQDYLEPIIRKWDRETQASRLTGVAANDCHHNQVFTVVATEDGVELRHITSRPVTTRVTASAVAGVAQMIRGRKPGDVIARLDFDPYDRSMRYVSTHVLARELDEAAVRDALRGGRAYVSHDWLCDPTGFVFGVGLGAKVVAVMGDEVELGVGQRILAEAPVTATLKLFRDGELIQSVVGRSLERLLEEAGVYRLEAWLEIDGESRPWVYSNPVYVRQGRGLR